MFIKESKSEITISKLELAMIKTILSKLLIFTSLFMLLMQTTNAFANPHTLQYDLLHWSFNSQDTADKKGLAISLTDVWNKDDESNWNCGIKLNSKITVTNRYSANDQPDAKLQIDIVAFKDANNVDCWIILEKSGMPDWKP